MTFVSSTCSEFDGYEAAFEHEFAACAGVEVVVAAAAEAAIVPAEAFAVACYIDIQALDIVRRYIAEVRVILQISEI